VRRPDELRPIRITRGYTEMTPGSVLMEMGRTRVLCTASFDDDVPPWMKDKGKGWLTAEYNMLPGSSPERVSRSALSGGRTKEIQRLIGRSLRAVVDLGTIGPAVLRIDCDVLQADGGTRTAALTGAYVALYQACTKLATEGKISKFPVMEAVAAISLGYVDGELLLDLAYNEDSRADSDFNVVMTRGGRFVEFQGTAEGAPFDPDQMKKVVDLALSGLEAMFAAQQHALGAIRSEK